MASERIRTGKSRRYMQTEKVLVSQKLDLLRQGRDQLHDYISRVVQQAEEVATPLMSETSKSTFARKYKCAAPFLEKQWQKINSLLSILEDSDASSGSEGSDESVCSISSNLTSVSQSTYFEHVPTKRSENSCSSSSTLKDASSLAEINHEAHYRLTSRSESRSSQQKPFAAGSRIPETSQASVTTDLQTSQLTLPKESDASNSCQGAWPQGACSLEAKFYGYDDSLNREMLGDPKGARDGIASARSEQTIVSPSRSVSGNFVAKVQNVEPAAPASEEKVRQSVSSFHITDQVLHKELEILGKTTDERQDLAKTSLISSTNGLDATGLPADRTRGASLKRQPEEFEPETSTRCCSLNGVTKEFNTDSMRKPSEKSSSSSASVLKFPDENVTKTASHVETVSAAFTGFRFNAGESQKVSSPAETVSMVSAEDAYRGRTGKNETRSNEDADACVFVKRSRPNNNGSKAAKSFSPGLKVPKKLWFAENSDAVQFQAKVDDGSVSKSLMQIETMMSSLLDKKKFENFVKSIEKPCVPESASRALSSGPEDSFPCFQTASQPPESEQVAAVDDKRTDSSHSQHPSRDSNLSATKRDLILLTTTSASDDWRNGKAADVDRKSSVSTASSDRERSTESTRDMPVVIPRRSFSVGDELEGMVLAAVDPHQFWIQTDDKDLNYMMVTNHMNDKGQVPKAKIDKDLDVGMYACAVLPFESLWNRVKIMEILPEEKRRVVRSFDSPPTQSLSLLEPSKVKVLFVDTGNVETVSSDQLHKMPSSVRKYPPVAVECRLAQIMPFTSGWCQLSKEFFYKLTFGKCMQATVLAVDDNGVCTVSASVQDPTADPSLEDSIDVLNALVKNQLGKLEEIYVSDDDDDDDDENAHFSTADESLKADSSNDGHGSGNNIVRSKPTLNAVIPEKDLEQFKFEKEVTLCHCETPTSFYVHLSNVEEQVATIDAELASLYNDDDRDDAFPGCQHVTENSYWATKFSVDGRWYRVRVLEIKTKVARRRKRNVADNPEEVRVQYIDYGNTENIKIRTLRPLLESHCGFAPFAVHCCLTDVYPHGLSLEEKQNLSADQWEWPADICSYFYHVLVPKKPCSMEVVKLETDKNTGRQELLHIYLWNLQSLNAPVNINRELVKAKYAMSESLNDPDFGAVQAADQLEGWDPMEEDYYSERNTAAVNDDDAEVAIVGYKSDTRMCLNKKCSGMQCNFEHADGAKRGAAANKVEAFYGGEPVTLPEEKSSVAVSVTAIFNPGRFYVVLPFGPRDINDFVKNDALEIELEKSSEVEDLMEELNKSYLKSVPPKNPNVYFSEGEICAALCADDGKWYRVRILRFDADKGRALVFYLDFGNQEWMPLSAIHHPKPEFVDVPYQAVECVLWGVEPVRPKWCRASNNWFENLVDSKYLTAYIEAKVNEVLHVQLYDGTLSDIESVNDMLVERKYARRANTVDTILKQLPAAENGFIRCPQ